MARNQRRCASFMRSAPTACGWCRGRTAGPRPTTTRSARAACASTRNAPLPPILHLAQFHPLDDHYGLSSLEAAAVAVELSLVECPAFALTLLHALWIG